MSGNKKIALYGGSFDPPHLGHRKLVEKYFEEFPNIDKLLIVPNRISPFKREKYFQPNECIELSMVNFQGILPDRIQVLDIEINKNNPSYTYETILEIKKMYPFAELDLIVGEDQLLDLPKWKEFTIISQEVKRFVTFRRTSDPGEPIPIPNELQSLNIHIMENSLWEESSSDWRRWPTNNYLYQPVAERIKEFSEKKFSQSEIERWKSIVSESTTPTRFQHVLRVAHIARELAEFHGYLFPEKAELAGLVHDITKQKHHDFHIRLFQKYKFDNYYEYPTPSYHAFSGKFQLMELGMTDIDILNAVARHTLGRKKMTFLEALIYTSDFLGSDFALNHPDHSNWMAQVTHRLMFGVFLKSKYTMENLIQHKKQIHIDSLDVYNESLEILNQD